MKPLTSFTLILVTLLICFTLLARDYLRYDAEIQARSIDRLMLELKLQFIEQHEMQPTEPEQTGQWQPNTFRMRPRDNTAAALSPASATSRGPHSVRFHE